MLEAVRCPHCRNDVAPGPRCSVCGHDPKAAPFSCRCLFCAAGMVCSDKTIALLLVMAVRSAWDDKITAANLGTPPTITESTADRLARAIQALEG